MRPTPAAIRLRVSGKSKAQTTKNVAAPRVIKPNFLMMMIESCADAGRHRMIAQGSQKLPACNFCICRPANGEQGVSRN